MLRYIPLALGVVVLAGATWWQARIVDRWGMSAISPDVLQERFSRLPHRIGDWVGKDEEVSKEVQEGAGAVAHVSRVYTNEQTGEVVALWLIAGHAKDIVRHTPDICYPAQGYRRARNEMTHKLPTQDGSEATFWTAEFSPDDQASAGNRRVFWAWSITPSDNSPPKWQAPSSPRATFRNTPSLFKMYFTSLVMVPNEEPSESPCTPFARICIPEVNKALFGDLPDTNTPSESSQANEAVAETPSESSEASEVLGAAAPAAAE
jgi:hypothetical protein